MRPHFLLLLGLALPAAAAEGFYDPTAASEIRQALEAMNLTEADLGFQKHASVGKAREGWYQGLLPVVQRLLDHPLDTPAVGQDLGRGILDLHEKGDVAGILKRCARLLDLPDPKGEPRDPSLQVDVAALPEPLRKPMAALIREASIAHGEVQAALAGLTPEERKAALAEEDEEKEGSPPISTLLSAWAKADRARLFQAAQRLAAAVQKAAKEIDPAVDLPGGTVSIETPFGVVLVSGKGPDVHKTPAFALVDLGGNDTYVGGAGASRAELPVSVAIDLGGDDTYLPDAERSPCQGSGCLGIGILLDAAGDDRYRAGSLSQGSGRFGVGILIDEAGEDRYEAAGPAQGAGAYGAGLLLDRSGNDRYDAGFMSQAFAGVQGVGVLSELSGNDLYYAGGRVPDTPLLPDRFQSLSQGFAIGHRPEAAGGVAVLADASGNDVYQGDVYAQGTSYWLSLGILYDAKGNDQYSATIYAQGTGVHLSVGCLLDMDGKDTYVCTNGVAQGSGHDFSVGCLYDQAGDDRYFAESFAQGAAGGYSVALLLDRDGSDQFVVRAENTQGRGCVGMLLDLGGKPGQITWRPKEGACAIKRGGIGVLRSDEAPPARAAPPPPEAVTAVTEDDLDRLFALTTLWEVGSNRPLVFGARDRMIAKGDAALAYLIPDKLDPENVYVMRALRAVCQGIGPRAVKDLLPQLDSPLSKARRASAQLLGSMGAQEAVPGLLKFLDDPDETIRVTGVEILGQLKAKGAAGAIAKILKESPNETVKVAAADALGSLEDPAGTEALAACLADQPITVRIAAAKAIEALGEAGVRKARELLKSPSHQVRLHGIEILGWAKAEAARGELAGLLKDPDWTVRLYAVRALEKMKDDAVRAAFSEMEKAETNPYVKSALAE